MRNILKKSTAVLLVGALSVSLVACDSKKVGKKEEKKIEEKKPVKKETKKVSLKEIDDRLMTIDDFLNEKEE